MIYFDNNSTTKICPQAIEKMLNAMQLPLNSSATHNYGRKAAKILDEARSVIKESLNAENYQITFTSSSTEANNTIIAGVEVENVILSKIEHSSVYNFRDHKKYHEINVLENGLIDIEDLKLTISQLKNSSFLCCLMLANNETGAIQNVAEVTKIIHQNNGLILSDIVQAVGKIEVDLEKLNIDFATISAHKFNGPQGIGAIISRKSLDFQPRLFGGKQEKNKRAGTVNIAAISAMAAAIKDIDHKISSQQKVKEMRDFLESEITSIAAENNASDQIKIFCQDVERLDNTSYISIKNADGQTQLINFDLNKIMVSAGTTCSSGTNFESRVLAAMKIDQNFIKGAVRVSLSQDNNIDEIKFFIKVWREFFLRHLKSSSIKNN
jgi:cysteine desulfurase